MMTRTIAAACLSLLALAGLAQEPGEPGLEQLSWMAGSWQSEDGDVFMQELWTEPRGGVMLGLHRDVKAGRPAAWEFLRIEDGPDGLVYMASPRGAPATPFELVSLGDRRAVFANPQHDFPKRLVYWIDAEGALHARADAGEGTDGPEWAWQPSP